MASVAERELRLSTQELLHTCRGYFKLRKVTTRFAGSDKNEEIKRLRSDWCICKNVIFVQKHQRRFSISQHFSIITFIFQSDKLPPLLPRPNEDFFHSVPYKNFSPFSHFVFSPLLQTIFWLSHLFSMNWFHSSKGLSWSRHESCWCSSYGCWVICILIKEGSTKRKRWKFY